MPELPEVEAVCRKIKPEITGRRIRGVCVLRPSAVKPQVPETLQNLAEGKTIRKVRRRGKNILIELSNALTIRIHLRMTGDLYVTDLGDLPAGVRVWLGIGNGQRLVFEDPRALGVVHICTAEEVAGALAGLGLEPLSRGFTPEALAEAMRGSRKPAKLFLMDQGHVAGLGNIYAAEALFRARVNPRKRADLLRPAQVKLLHSAIVSVLRAALRSANMAYTRPGRFREAERFPLCVYGREGEPCPVCGRSIGRFEQGGRSTYYCPACQR